MASNSRTANRRAKKTVEADGEQLEEFLRV